MTTTLIRPDTRFEEIVDQLTRRGFLGGALGTAGLLALSACGSNEEASSSSLRTRKVDSVHGTIAVPADPRRVVTTDGFSMATMFDLGLTPVGVYSAGAEYVEPEYLARWRTIAKISSGKVGGPVDVEKVAALNPDLIIGIDASQPPYGQLKEIAPTVILPFSDARIPWRDLAEDTATTLGRESALAGVRRRYRDRAEHIRTTYADVLAHTRWDLVQGGFDSGQYWLYGPTSPIGVILAAAGARFASASAGVKASAGQASLSYERIDELADANAIFYYTTNNGAPANLGPKLFSQDAFEKLTATRTKALFGSIYFLPSSYGDALGALNSFESALKSLQRTGR